ncbi:sideroflexin-1 [Diorhabda carinulata]|uniref:sideroflexin-1 n=1 Tax=Diorhabda carinulata TaxID=1163345 RepID=UPI0025A24E10|nr:sideroflexin-1 [Diorhabda carinulata]XP_057661117.1 sideroflexin-1 [Diorhabda carinulata]XP_057661119.1 sideroflexin-1 [Diorhabda carinulata]XP_057661120.1 sideroflexin-1 [Diorhabda carinulata]
MGLNDEKNRINIDEPRYDQNTYIGRAKHFFITTNPLNVFASNKKLEEAKCIVEKYRRKEPLPDDLTEDKLWRAKNLYDSAFHPDTGEKMFVLGRMSAQVPSNMVITGGMITFYRSTPAVVFWQWLNQSFNALVNYSNRSGDIVQTDQQLLTSYLCATGGAVGTALGLNSLTKSMPSIIGRMVPFAAVAAANCINIPMMRAQELKQGTPVYDEQNNKLGYSRAAATSGIAQVVFSRICMALPGMVFTPIVMNSLERKGFLRRYPWMNLPISVGFLGLCLTFATPLACAFFKQKASIAFTSLETELQEEIKSKYKDVPTYVFYNKGL